MPHYSDLQRWKAVIAFYKGNKRLKQAVAEFRRLVGTEQYKGFSSPREFISAQVKKFLKFGDVKDRYADRPPSQQKVVPDDVIKKCTTALKGGYSKQLSVQHADGTTTISTEHRYYSSISEACADNPQLASVIEEYQVTPQYLLKRMHDVDENLVMRVAEFKHSLTADQQLARQACASQLLLLWQQDNGVLLGTWWIDETSVWIISTADRSHQVWCDAHDQGVKLVLSSPHVAAHQKIKVHLFAAVNAIKGAAFYEFTTGTTDITRIHLPQDKVYKVSLMTLT